MSIRWEDYQTIRFKPKLREKKAGSLVSPRGSCGVYALSYLTGEPVWEIDKSTPKRGWWSDEDMLRYLKKRGFVCHEMNEDTIHARKREFDSRATSPYYKRNVNHLNVLLISQHTQREEGSWAVVYDNRYYHGNEVEFFSGYELVVNPFWTGYVIWHPKWKTASDKLRVALTMNFLGSTPLDKTVDLFNPLSAQWYQLPLDIKAKEK